VSRSDFDDSEAITPKRRRPPRPKEEDEDDELEHPVSTLIPCKNPKALIAYYCGVFSLIPCVGAVLGPIALIFGILGLNYVKRHPTAKGTGHAIAGIVLGSLTLLGNWGVIILIALGAGAAALR
jgi:hypothetical protein